MIAKISARLVDFFIFHNKELEQTKEVYQYGCEIILSTVINIIIVIVCGLLLGETVIAVTIFVLFATIRSYSGGYHAQTYFKCNFLF